ncbi:bifunctional DNA-formamidopyrimidine glycosylase/DNA-(apurinic or apyrimidinic site) lyase [Sphingomonas sp. HDW15A]|uniref:bifunctional DNA-formamidopyrimidine glycosylase/DNA-(apurinic or apyrimidinic site) lyase n=1 Tax=Sphingomonas sp. HDW15A TaxID=2714942 RepID=UPI00140BEA4F|nr:bifunctional DNA-formamidopyrimidine glycosylase/DNA-(apurinic or apyrimidinic site) lyase [Sphingomonas sp. HDW15A]QIK96198.1 bifunctional DNA-formamidopyrimidine glycosylase/DNA-(apurinic or apyrimidinic site) lyase [Sphingomonas sp. HDW15A]
MPELPEVETTVRGLERVLKGRRLTMVEPRRADLRRSIPHDLGQRLTGAKVIELGRRAKYGLIGTDRGDTLIFHLGMSGRWRIDPVGIDKHDHLLIETDNGHRLALNDPRRFGSLDLAESQNIADWDGFVGLGPEPLGGAIHGLWLKQKLAGRTAAIKLMLLDQRIVAGLGNIYVCEALFRARIDPRKPAGKVSRAKLDALAAAIPEVLEEAIRAGGSSLRDFAAPDGELGYFSKAFDVYDREGQDCRGNCGGTVRRIVQGGRSTFFCPRCQR